MFVPFENSNAIAKAIVELLDDPESMVEVHTATVLLTLFFRNNRMFG